MKTDVDKRIDELETRLRALEAQPPFITRFMDDEQKQELQIIMEELISDTTWGTYFHYHTFFESLDGWPNQGSTVSVAVNRLYIDPNGTTVGYAKKKAVLQNTLSYDEESRYRTSFTFSNALSDGQEMSGLLAYLGTGHAITGGSNNLLDDGLAAGTHYGFYVDADVLYGVTSDGSNYTTLALMSGIKYGDAVAIEARYYPGERVDFYASDPQDGVRVGAMTLRGTIGTTLPSGLRQGIGEFSLQDVTGTSGVVLNAGFCEVLQQLKQ